MVQKQTRRRRKRTTIDPQKRKELEKLFVANRRPKAAEVAEVSVGLDLEREVVRVWFCNRRQKDRQDGQVAGWF